MIVRPWIQWNFFITLFVLINHVAVAQENLYQQVMRIESVHERGVQVDSFSEDQMIQFMDEAWRAEDEEVAFITRYKLARLLEESPADPNRYLNVLRNVNQKYDERLPATIVFTVVHNIAHWPLKDKCEFFQLVINAVTNSEISEQAKAIYVQDFDLFLNSFLKDIDQDTSLEEEDYENVDKELNFLINSVKQEFDKEIVLKNGKDHHHNFLRFLSQAYLTFNEREFKHPERISNSFKTIRNTLAL